jgi:hypothetical protein
MALAVTVKSTSMNQSELILNFVVVASVDYTAGGDTLDFSTATFPIGGGLPATLPPRFVEIQSQVTGGPDSGFTYAYVGGTTPANGKMQVFGTGTASQDPGNEIPGAPTAYPAGVTGDTIIGRAYFAKLQ